MPEVMGKGRLADAVSDALVANPVSGAPAAVSGAPRTEGRIVVVVSDGWEPELVAEAAARAAAERVPLLPVQVEPGRAVIGPAVLPGVPGCQDCVALRRAAADDEPTARTDLVRRHAGRLAEPSPWLTTFAVRAVRALAVAEVTALLAGSSARTRGALLVVDLEHITTRVHPFLPDPLCPTCATPPADGPDAGTPTLVARPTRTPDSLRTDDLVTDADRVRRTYVDPLTGVVPRVREALACGLAVSYAPAGWRDSGHVELGIGRATDRVASGLAAVLEAVERRSGLAPSGRRTVVRSSFAQLADQAVDPRELGLFAPEQHALAGFPYPPFDEHHELEWVWAHSFRRDGPVLVPRTHAYYGHGPDHSERPLVYETSNGCALGSCFEEATLHGLLEVAERDAFLLTWYARRAAPMVDLGSARSTDVRLLAARIRRAHAYDVFAFDLTAEQGVPVVATLAVDRDGTDPGRPAVLCSAGAHLDPERACWAALGELALVVEHHLQEYGRHAERAAAMAADPDLVRDMEDHAFLYGHRDTLPRWDFLLRATTTATFADAFAHRPVPTSDLRDDLLGLVRRYLDTGMDVVVVDQTGPEAAACGLSAVKVIVPGTLPMTFGHRNRRVHGLPRLTAALAGAEPNPHPHPFP